MVAPPRQLRRRHRMTRRRALDAPVRQLRAVDDGAEVLFTGRTPPGQDRRRVGWLGEVLVAEDHLSGYDVENTLRRRRGRPPIGTSAASVESIRLDPELLVALTERARRDHETTSAVIRQAFAEVPRRRLSEWDSRCCPRVAQEWSDTIAVRQPRQMRGATWSSGACDHEVARLLVFWPSASRICCSPGLGTGFVCIGSVSRAGSGGRRAGMRLTRVWGRARGRL